VLDENKEMSLANVFLSEQQKRHFIVDDTVFTQVKIDPN